MRIEPPASVPSASGSRPSATAAALPPDEPPALQPRVERIAGRPEQRVVAGAAEPHHRRVGLADEDRAGLLDPLGEGAVPVGDVVLERADAAEGRRPAGLEVEQVLDRRRHAMERPERVAAHHRVLGALRLLPRALGVEEDQRVEARVALLDPGERRVHHLDRRQFAPPDAAGQLGGAHVGQCIIHHVVAPVGNSVEDSCDGHCVRIRGAGPRCVRGWTGRTRTLARSRRKHDRSSSETGYVEVEQGCQIVLLVDWNRQWRTLDQVRSALREVRTECRQGSMLPT